MANALAQRGHDVEVVSMYRHTDRPVFRVDDAVRMRALLDEGARAQEHAPRARVARRVDAALRARRSCVIHPDDARNKRFSLRSDIALVQRLRSLRGGVLVTTRAGLNMAAARFVRRDVVRVARSTCNSLVTRRICRRDSPRRIRVWTPW